MPTPSHGDADPRDTDAQPVSPAGDSPSRETPPSDSPAPQASPPVDFVGRAAASLELAAAQRRPFEGLLSGLAGMSEALPERSSRLWEELIDLFLAFGGDQGAMAASGSESAESAGPAAAPPASPEEAGFERDLARARADQLTALHGAFERLCDNLLQSGDHATLCSLEGSDAGTVLREACAVEMDTLPAAVEALEAAHEAARATAGVPAGPATLADRVRRALARRRRLAEAGRWERSLAGRLADWRKDLDLSLFQFRVQLQRERTRETLRRRLSERIGPIFATLEARLEEGLGPLRPATDGAGPPPLAPDERRRQLLGLGHRLLRSLRSETLPALLEALDQARVPGLYTDNLLRVERDLALIGESHSVLLPARSGPPLRLIEVPLGELASRELGKLAGERASATVEELVDRLEEAQRGVALVDQSVEAVFSAGLELLREDGRLQQAEEEIRAGLERILARSRDLKADLDAMAALLSERLEALSRELTARVGRLTDSSDPVGLRLRVARKRASDLRKRVFGAGRRLAERFGPRSGRLLKRLQGQFGSGVRRLRQATGLAAGESIDERLATFLKETDRRFGALPGIYQHLFRLQPQQEERYFCARESELARGAALLRGWLDGRGLALAVVAEKGGGKTSYLHRLEAEGKGAWQPVWLSLDESISGADQLLPLLAGALGHPEAAGLAELAATLKEDGRRRLLFLENLHNLFLRTVKGFDGLREFLLFLAETREQIGWVVSCGHFGWRYLSRVLPLERYFSRPIRLEGLDARELEDLVLLRHRVSGFRLVFDPPETGRDRRRLQRLRDERQRHRLLQRRYFDRLRELSAGNIRAALVYWLSSVREIREDTLVIGPPQEFDPAFLQQLPPEDLFYLGALLQHEMLDAGQLATVFRSSEGAATLVVDRLRELGVLTPCPGGFGVHSLLYRPVVKVLRERNILT